MQYDLFYMGCNLKVWNICFDILNPIIFFLINILEVSLLCGPAQSSFKWL